MVEQFHNNIAIALQEFGQSRGYNMDFDYYKDLAWGGLHHTDTFKSKVETERDRIMNVVFTEQFNVEFS